MAFARYAWLVLLGVGLLNCLSLWRRARPHIERDPELKVGYRRLIYGITFWMNLPWMVMGVGCTVGGVPSIFEYFFPGRGDPFVWAFWVVLFAEFLLLGYWALWCGGAEAMVRHPGLLNFPITSARR